MGKIPIFLTLKQEVYIVIDVFERINDTTTLLANKIWLGTFISYISLLIC
jgi:hypothetical protein